MSGYQLPGRPHDQQRLARARSTATSRPTPTPGTTSTRRTCPHAVVSGVGDQPIRGLRPDDAARLAASRRSPASPRTRSGTPPRTASTPRCSATVDSGTNEFAGGSALQGPTITVNVTATSAIAGTDLQVKLGRSAARQRAAQLHRHPARQLPGAGEQRTLPSVVGDGAVGVDQRHAVHLHGDTTWTDPTYLNTVYTTALGGLVNVTAKAACAPGLRVDRRASRPRPATTPARARSRTAPRRRCRTRWWCRTSTPTRRRSRSRRRSTARTTCPSRR